MPLKKALALIDGKGLLEVKSSFQISSIGGGPTITLRENLHILARRGGFFRAEISPIGEDGSPGAKVLAVCDGKRVWTYRPGLRAYSVVTRQAFLNSDAEPNTLGIAADIFDNGQELTELFRSVTKENNNATLKELTDIGLIVTSKVQPIGSVDCIVYRMLIQKQALSYLFYVDPQTNALKRFDLTGNTDGATIAIQETLTLLRVPASVPPGTFTWTPPPGAKKSAAVTVDPF